MKETVFSALAEPNRLHIVELLRSGPLTVGEIAERLRLNQPQTSKHLRVLHDSGLVEVQPDANRRFYKLRHQPLIEMDDWLESFRRIWNERFDNLDDYLRKLQGQDKEQDDKKNDAE
ncbi:ArsR/SmtB family transcription factor [Paenibacillus sp. PL91]|uniref:ArsR/SmtB family transcription factor n=1 Tax=Paenibacillus sp. PL91 TaxID=2729538 RepID=UPI00145E4EEF|nr:metalloregulator ArsR/SmtB family transcription factor [Paenibacillus sp. PL91]MBC9203169.1 winged helix-turn-helix transcriptional regulator [Paenibacillus sp. PL91]